MVLEGSDSLAILARVIRCRFDCDAVDANCGTLWHETRDCLEND